MMKNHHKQTIIFLSAACLCAVLMLQGCSSAKDAAKGVNPESKASSSKDDALAEAFTTVSSNPLDENIQYALWVAANSAEEPISSEVSTEPLKQLADKRTALVAEKGIHYTEASSAMGFKTSAEYWIRAGKFKKVEDGKITVFDGKSYVVYDPIAKTGERYTKEAMAADITIQVNSMLPSLAASPYKKLAEQNVNGFDCDVFFLDIEVMGMKGNTLFVNKENGMLMKYLLGDEEKGISNTVTKFEAGGFDDKVFTVPTDITVLDD